ncbi:MAG: hypothetical protein LC126_18515 [Bryobacterales bacterium]|nr:hypothetical protein [Bryobacterales bacterium]
MDAILLLREVSSAYRGLKSLAVEAVMVTESGDEDLRRREEQRVRFFYKAPDRIRYEPCGKKGTVEVNDGEHLHTCFLLPGPGGGAPYYRTATAEMCWLPHRFRPEFPLSNEPVFLFAGIEERVAKAEVLREEDGCYVVSVAYEPSPHPGVIAGGPVLYWVHPETWMVMRRQGDLGHRFPMGDEVQWSRHTVMVRTMGLNERLPEETFRFTPPAEAVLAGGRSGTGGGSGTAFSAGGPDGPRRLEHRGWHEWDGETLVDHSVWKTRGVTLNFERRMIFSTDGKEVRVEERIRGPLGEVKGEFRLGAG